MPYYFCCLFFHNILLDPKEGLYLERKQQRISISIGIAGLCLITFRLLLRWSIFMVLDFNPRPSIAHHFIIRWCATVLFGIIWLFLQMNAFQFTKLFKTYQRLNRGTRSICISAGFHLGLCTNHTTWRDIFSFLKMFVQREKPMCMYTYILFICAGDSKDPSEYREFVRFDGHTMLGRPNLWWQAEECI